MRCGISLQMSTLGEAVKEDITGMLEKVASIGYRGVEFTTIGINNIQAVSLKKHLDGLGLKASGSIFALQDLTGNFDRYIEYNLQIGSRYIILGYTNFSSKTEYFSLAEQCNSMGEKCRQNGIQFCYHNHAHEFKLIDGQYALDILLSNTDPELVKTEIDVYWVQRAGLDPIEVFTKYAGRSPLIHLKDMEDNDNQDFAEIGNGIIDMKGIVERSEEAGTEWLVVEQDRCKRPVFESAAISFGNLVKLTGIICRHPGA